MAAVLAGGDGALLSHRSAARLWGLMTPAVESIDVTVPSSRLVERKGIASHVSLVADDERVVVEGIPTAAECTGLGSDSSPIGNAIAFSSLRPGGLCG